MKHLFRYKIWMALLVLSPVFIAIGAYRFTSGNVQLSHAWFLWGFMTMVAGILWLFISERAERHTGDK